MPATIIDPVYTPIANSARPIAKPDVGAWAEEHMRFDLAVDASPRYVLAKAPYAKFVFNWWNDEEIEEIFLLWPTQAGKTSCMVVLMSYVIANDPGPLLFAQASDAPTTAFMKHRLKPTMKKTFPDAVSGKAKDPNWSEEHGSYIRGTHIWPAWSTSIDRMRSWSRRYIFGDETSIWKCSRHTAWERTKQFKRNRKGLWGTTPTLPHEQSWLAATKVFRLHRFQVPCPDCGTFQTLEFENLQYSHCKHKDEWVEEKLLTEVYYPCAACNYHITEQNRPRIIQLGEANTEFPERSKRQTSLRITCMDVPGISWGESVLKFLEARANPEDKKNFVNSWLVRPWEEEGEGVSASHVLTRN